MKKQAALEKRSEVKSFCDNTRNHLLSRYEGEEVTPQFAEEFRQEFLSLIKAAGHDDHVRDVVVDIKGTTSMFCTVKLATLEWDEE